MHGPIHQMHYWKSIIYWKLKQNPHSSKLQPHLQYFQKRQKVKNLSKRQKLAQKPKSNAILWEIQEIQWKSLEISLISGVDEANNPGQYPSSTQHSTTIIIN
jgi:hypothetical protein